MERNILVPLMVILAFGQGGVVILVQGMVGMMNLQHLLKKKALIMQKTISNCHCLNIAQ